jgi:ParB-like chromosome segregation protein Spo0J
VDWRRELFLARRGADGRGNGGVRWPANGGRASEAERRDVHPIAAGAMRKNHLIVNRSRSLGRVIRRRARPRVRHGNRMVPVGMESIPIEDIDGADQRFQFRFASNTKQLGKSLAERGQLAPIKVMAADNAYRILDGFSRYVEAKRLGWRKIKALIYPSLSDKDAKKIAWESNICRTNLCFPEKVNAMLLARRDELLLEEIASIFHYSVRQVSRFLAIPDKLEGLVDGERVTMAHVEVFKTCLEELTNADVEELVEWIKGTRATVKQLKTKLKADYSLSETRGRPKNFGCLENGRVRVYAFEFGKQSSGEEWAAARAFLLEVVRQIDKRTRSDATAPEKQSDPTSCRARGLGRVGHDV